MLSLLAEKTSLIKYWYMYYYTCLSEYYFTKLTTLVQKLIPILLLMCILKKNPLTGRKIINNYNRMTTNMNEV